MSMRYDLTAMDILKILGFLKPQNPEIIKKYEDLEAKLNLTFPKTYKNFLINASGLSLLKDAAIFLDDSKITTLNQVLRNECDVDKQYYFRVKLLEDSEGYAAYAEEDYLLIGSNTGQIWNHEDYEWYAVMLGIRIKDLNKKNPPVYINYHYHNYMVWHKFCNTLSEFLLTAVLDVYWKEKQNSFGRAEKSGLEQVSI